MSSRYNWLVHDHSDHEELLTECLDAVDVEDWHTAERVFSNLIGRLKTHIELEEEVLFPAYESRTEDPEGPTRSLRDEHIRIVQFIHDTSSVLETRNSQAGLECLVELERLLVGHHEKEEDIFLPMASLILESDREELLQNMRDFITSKKTTEWKV